MIQATNIHKTYADSGKDLHILNGIDLSVSEGEFVSLVGPSGVGKSTLLHILGGLDTPTKGNVSLHGQDIYKLREKELCRLRNEKIGFVFQFYHLLAEFTVMENVLMPLLISESVKTNTGQLKEKAIDLLKEVGLGKRLRHFPSQLSGGEQQRVAIVRALVNNPHVLLCDEPTGNLDSATGEEIVSLLRKINKSDGMTIIVVTHNLDLASRADCTYLMKDGLLIHLHKE
jgi:ABC-type lipoprotein export system ATPase subunit